MLFQLMKWKKKKIYIYHIFELSNPKNVRIWSIVNFSFLWTCKTLLFSVGLAIFLRFTGNTWFKCMKFSLERLNISAHVLFFLFHFILRFSVVQFCSYIDISMQCTSDFEEMWRFVLCSLLNYSCIQYALIILSFIYSKWFTERNLFIARLFKESQIHNWLSDCVVLIWIVLSTCINHSIFILLSRTAVSMSISIIWIRNALLTP